MHSTQITANEVEKHRYDELDDIVATLGTSMLGLTIGCARCHDHKFDALPQADYYRLLSAFTRTVRSEKEFDFDPEGYRRNKQAWDLAHAPFVEAIRVFERDRLPARLAEWERDVGLEGSRREFVRLVGVDSQELASKGKALFEPQADGSYLVTGHEHRPRRMDRHGGAATGDLRALAVGGHAARFAAAKGGGTGTERQLRLVGVSGDRASGGRKHECGGEAASADERAGHV